MYSDPCRKRSSLCNLCVVYTDINIKLAVVGVVFDALPGVVVHTVHDDVGVMVRQVIIGQRVGVSLVMMEVDTDDGDALVGEPRHETVEVFYLRVGLDRRAAFAYAGAARPLPFLPGLAVGVLHILALHGASGLLLDEHLEVFKHVRQRLRIRGTAPRHVEMPESVPTICLPELPGDSLAVGGETAVVRLGGAYVAGPELDACLHVP